MRYKIEWIYTRTKVSGPDSLELALIMKMKERRKNEKWAIFQTSCSGIYYYFDDCSWILLDAQFAGDFDFHT